MVLASRSSVATLPAPVDCSYYAQSRRGFGAGKDDCVPSQATVSSALTEMPPSPAEEECRRVREVCFSDVGSGVVGGRVRALAATRWPHAAAPIAVAW
jgi:hypothetical protein